VGDTGDASRGPSNCAHMKRTLVLINPNRMTPVVSPVALDYLFDTLVASDWQPYLLDLALVENWQEQIEACLDALRPEAVCLSVRNLDDCFLPSRDFCIAAVRHMVQRVREKTDAPVIVGGSGYSIVPERGLDYLGADFGIAGDGEAALPELLARLPGSNWLTGVPGLIWRDGETIRRNGSALAVARTLKASFRTFVENRRYFDEGGQVGIETKRGCPMDCIYCADTLSKGKRTRLKQPRDVAEEFKALLGQGVTHFHLCDSEFNVPLDHALAVCSELIRTGLNSDIRWYTYASPVPFSPELASLMKEAGCAGIDFGVDSADPQLLSALGRSFAPEDIKRTAEICRQSGLVFMFDLLIGGPGETRETVRHTVDFMDSIAPTRVGLSCGVRVYPGTALASRISGMSDAERSECLHGQVDGNEDYFEPVFYVSPELGQDVISFVASLVQGNRRFFLPVETGPEAGYNYNDNTALVDAITQGYRGAYWDILRRLQEGE